MSAATRRLFLLAVCATAVFGLLPATASARSCPNVVGGTSALPLPMTNVRVVGAGCGAARKVGTAWWTAWQGGKVVYGDDRGTTTVRAAGRSWLVISRLPPSCVGHENCNASALVATSGRRRISWTTSS